jgi:DNA modification methylase
MGLADESVHCCVTSPPYYGLRDYGVAGQLGLEPTPAEYVAVMVAVFRDVRRVLRRDGTCWIVIGDSYASGEIGRYDHKQAAGSSPGVAAAGRSRIGVGMGAREQRKFITGTKPKDLLGMPWMLAFALRDDGWYLRSEITWAKRAPMPESVTDRPTGVTEKVFLLAKNSRYFYDAEAVKEEAEYGYRDWNGEDHYKRGDITRGHSGKTTGGCPGKRNMRNWWLLGPEPFPEAHFATFPTEIPRRAILAGCPVGGTVLDPFFGAGTTGLVADQLQRDCIGIELNSSYAAMAERRVRDDCPLFVEIAAE